jgi:hypothetical protein
MIQEAPCRRLHETRRDDATAYCRIGFQPVFWSTWADVSQIVPIPWLTDFRG